MTNDSALLERYSRMGDAEAFAELARRYARLVYGTCLRITANAQEAEDITQECFLELARKAGTVRSSLPGWLHKVAKNRALNTIRKNATRRQYEQAAVGADDSRSEPGWAEIVPIVDEAVDKLSDELREPIVLHYFEGLTQAEVAASLGINQSTVSRHLDRAVDSLRKELKKAGVVLTVGALAGLLTDNATASVPVSAVAALGKIAVSGISGGTATGVAGGSIAASKALLAGKAALLLGVLAVSLVVGQKICANRVADPASSEPASTGGVMAKRDPSALQVYLLPDTVSKGNANGTWQVSGPGPNQAGAGYVFERREPKGSDEAQVVETLDSAKQPQEIMNRVVHVGSNPPILTTNDLLPNAQARNNKDGKPVLDIEFNAHGTKVFVSFTSKHVGECMGIFINGRLISVPVIREAIKSGRVRMEGFADLAEAEALAKQINGGSVGQP